MSQFLQNQEFLESTVSGILFDYIQITPEQLPLKATQSLRDDLALESLSLVSVVLRIADELGVDALNISVGLHSLKTVGDLVTLSQNLQKSIKTERYL